MSRRVAQCKYWNGKYVTFQWFTIGLFCKYTKNVNIYVYICYIIIFYSGKRVCYFFIVNMKISK